MEFILFNLFLIVVIIFLLLVLSMVWPPHSPWAPWWRTSTKVSRAVCRLAKVTKKDIVYELGSGDAATIITAAKECGAKGVGIEIDPLRFIVSKILVKRNGVSKKVRIKRKNFFHENLSSATIVYVYLVPKTLKKLLPKFKKELPNGARIVSYKYQIDLPVKKYDKENDLRLYIL